MAIDTGVSIRMSHIDSIAKAIHVNGDTTDIAVGNGINQFSLPILGLDIYATMEMERTWLTKVASKNNVIVDGRSVLELRVES